MNYKSCERYERLVTFGELEITRVETVGAYLKVLYQHLSERAVEIHENKSRYSVPWPRFESAHRAYKSEAL